MSEEVPQQDVLQETEEEEEEVEPGNPMENLVATLQQFVQRMAENNPGNATRAAPKISIKLPSYRGEPGENIYVWCLQLSAIFTAQGIENEVTRIHYASTALEEGALHW